jgi:prepilin peptidase CpaA
MSPFHVFILLALALTAAAAALDYCTGHIPNELTLGALAFAPLSHALVAVRADGSWMSGLAGAGGSLAGMLVGAALPLLLFRMGAIGGGDVKLFAALGAVALTGFTVQAEAYAFMVAAVHGVAVVARKKTLSSTARAAIELYWRRGATKIDAAATGMTAIRLAPSVCAGTCISALLLWSQS